VTEQTSSITGVTSLAVTILARSNFAAVRFLTLLNGAESFLLPGVLQISNKFRNFYVTQLFIIFFTKGSPFTSVSRQINPIHTLQFYLFKIYVISFIIYDVGLLSSLFTSLLPTKTLWCALSFTSYMKHSPPISSFLLKIH
jgi:hypothetical protein